MVAVGCVVGKTTVGKVEVVVGVVAVVVLLVVVVVVVVVVRMVVDVVVTAFTGRQHTSESPVHLRYLLENYSSSVS